MYLTTLCLKRMFSCIRARRRSRYRYLSRSNSSTGRSRSISNGGVSEVFRTLRPVASTSISPVGRSRFSFPSGRRTRSEERRVGKECRSRCDWSSDVCSSDLERRRLGGVQDPQAGCLDLYLAGRQVEVFVPLRAPDEIGRASCRERV